MKILRAPGLEEEAYNLPIEDDHTLAFISIAISLKRIADAAEHIREDTEQLRAGMRFINERWGDR